MTPAVGGVGGERLLPRRLAGEHAPHLAAACDPEVEGSADPLRGETEAVARRVAYEEDPVLRRGPKPVRDEVALMPNGRDTEAGRRVSGRLLDRDARIVRGGADA